ncbi:hypothetical protein PoB_000930400 [Plakobranchus ocellatus]|uniref:Uncharacterized protein n=1 Tax=Plakobranchus ocellatus TaxID=259542 RepID=A0AAV3YIH0_9GAST|nr:hypothetical protein PoB_000930400 [Plakobranchus ocellatus]
MQPSLNELVFSASLPPLGFATYFVQLDDTVLRWTWETRNKGLILRGKFAENGYIKQLTNLVTNMTAPLTQNFYYYELFVGDNLSPDNQYSGTYIFRPKTDTDIKIKLTKFEGIFKEARQVFNSWVTHVVRVYMDEAYAEFEWTIGPIPKRLPLPASEHNRELGTPVSSLGSENLPVWTAEFLRFTLESPRINFKLE